MGTMEHEDDFVILDESESTDSTPDWAPGFRALCRYIQEQGHLEALDEMEGLDRRADAYRLVDVVMFLVAYFFANPAEGGLRDFWYSIREDEEKLAAWYGRTEMPSCSSVSRFLEQISEECVREFGNWALGAGTDLGDLADRPEAAWRDTHGDGWHVVDWDPKARLLRQRTLIEGEEYPEAEPFGPKHGEPGQVGRKRGELKFVRGLMAHAGTSQWVGAYREPGNGTLVDHVEVCRQVRRTLDDQLGEQLEERPPVMRLDGEGGEVPPINGVDEAGFCPLTRLKQYHLLKRSDVREVIEQEEPTVAPGTGTGPEREVFEIGEVPLTSSRQVEEPDSLDEAITIRLVVSRYPKTEADQGPGKLIDGMRYELFGTYLPADRWPAEAVVEMYFGRGTVENRFAGGDREIQLEKLFSLENPAGQHLATTVGLWVWNLCVELGDRLVDHEAIPEPARRKASGEAPEDQEPVSESPPEPDREEAAGDNRRRTFAETMDRRPDQAREEAAEAHPASEPIPMDAPQTELSEATLRRLNRQGLSYRVGDGVVECSFGHYLAPKRSGSRDETHVTFRVIGQPCRGCPHREGCTSSRKPNFRKEVTLPNEEVPEAVAIREGEQQAPIGVQRDGTPEAGPFKVRRPGFLPARRRKALRRAARRAEIRVTLEDAEPMRVADCAEEYLHHRRTHQRLPRKMRRRYRRLSPQATVRSRWVRGAELAEAVE